MCQRPSKIYGIQCGSMWTIKLLILASCIYKMTWKNFTKLNISDSVLTVVSHELKKNMQCMFSGPYDHYSNCDHKLFTSTTAL